MSLGEQWLKMLFMTDFSFYWALFLWNVYRSMGGVKDGKIHGKNEALFSMLVPKGK